MKIGFPAAGTEHDKRMMLSNDFTACGLIGIHDTESDQTTVYSKEDLGLSLMEWLYKNKIRTIITPEISPMAIKVFREEGVDVYKAESKLLELNIELLLNMCLPAFSVLEVYTEGALSCSSNCSSCNSNTCN